MTHFIELHTPRDEPFPAWAMTPEKPNGHGLVILPEVYNINDWLRGVAQHYADEGFTVLAPDLFWRQQTCVHLDYDQPELARAQGHAADIDRIVGDVGQAARWLRNALGSQAKVAVVGFCIGGRLALLARAREPVDLVISYYGVQLDQHLEELTQLQVPTLLHFGDQDPWVPTATVAAVEQATAGKNNITIHHYDAGHGFARTGYAPFQEAADAAAWDRNLKFLRG